MSRHRRRYGGGRGARRPAASRRRRSRPRRRGVTRMAARCCTRTAPRETRRSRACTHSSSAPHVSRSRAAGRRCRICAETSSTTSPTKPPTTRLMSVLRRLDDFRGASRFTTWAYKFALLEAAVKLRKRAWQGREIPLEPESWDLFSSAGLGPDAEAEQSELLAAVQSAIADVLTPHQRSVLVALALNGVPIDVLAERLNTNRGALYKTLARRAAQAARASRSSAASHSTTGWRKSDRQLGDQADARSAARAGGARSRLRRLLRGARPLRRARAGRRRRGPRRFPACARTSPAARPAARSTTACTRS